MPDPNAEQAEWLKTLTYLQRMYILGQFTDGQQQGYAEGTADAKAALRIKRYLVPIVMLAVVAGITAQRLLNLV